MKRIFYPSLLLLVVLQGFGFCLAAHKPLWNDELFTQTGILSQSYRNVILGKNSSEGNTAPLFYIQQKIFCDIFHFKTPQAWDSHHWDHVDPFANIFLRILPVSWMSSFFLLLFLYFSYRFNVCLGLFGLLVGLTTPILWLFWAEARPYGLWVLLTGFQMILFLEILGEKAVSSKKWLCLSLAHILLSLTCVLSFCQIVTVSAALLIKERRWYQYIFLLAVPLLLIFYYRPHSSADDVIFIISVEQMIFDASNGVRLYIPLLYFVLLRVYFLQNKNVLPKIFNNDDIAKAFPFFLSIFLMILVMEASLFYLQSHATGHGQYVVTRHIIFLAPVTIIGIAYLTGLLWQNLKTYSWLRISMLLVIAGLLLWRINDIWGHIQYLFVGNPFA